MEKNKLSGGAFFDIKGEQTGQPITKKRGVNLLIAIALFIIFMLIPMDSISPTASPTVALLVAVIYIWITGALNMGVSCILLVVGALLLKLINFGTFCTAFGSSPFAMMIGMFIVSMGASRTNIAKRVAYFFLSRMGNSPALILLAIITATAVISAFVSNLGTTIVMASISIAIMDEMGEEKGKSGLGKAIMIGIPIASMIGGMALITGSPSTNMMGISMLESITDGAYTVTYNQWAAIGSVCAVLLIIPTWFVYKKCFHIKNKSGENKVDTAQFKQKLRELGPMRGAELRWVIIVIFFVGSMVSGLFPTPVAALFCALLCMLPVIGVVKPEDAMKSLPMDVLILIGFTPVIADMISGACLGEWLVTNLFGWTIGLPPFVLMLVMALVMTLLINFCANATLGLIAVVILAFTPLVLASGMNPSLILLPAMFLGSHTTVLGAQTNVVLTYQHGYWNMKDPIKPGLILMVMWTIVIVVVTYFMGPLIGMPIYI